MGIIFVAGISKVDFLKQLFFAHSWGERNFSFNYPSWSVSVEILTYACFFFIALSGFLKKPAHAVLTFIIIVVVRRSGMVFYTDIIDCLYFFITGSVCIKMYDVLIKAWHKGLFITTVFILFLISNEFSLSKMNIFWNLSVNEIFLCFFLVFPGLYAFKYLRMLDKIPNRMFIRVGELTYSIYLVHFPLQLLLVTFFIKPDLELLSSKSFFILYLGLVILIGFLIYHIFEKPVNLFFRKLN